MSAAGSSGGHLDSRLRGNDGVWLPISTGTFTGAVATEAMLRDSRTVINLRLNAAAPTLPMNREESIALFERCEAARRDALDAGKSYDEAHEAAKAVWNAWAEPLIAERKALEKAGKWEIQTRLDRKRKRFTTVGLNGDSRRLIRRSEIDLSSLKFVGYSDAERKGKEAQKSVADSRSDAMLFHGERVDFAGYVFPGDAFFVSTEFGSEARFEGAVFSGIGWFRGAIFRRNVRFVGTGFQGVANFSNTDFLGYALFPGAYFSEMIQFEDASFLGGASFERATIAGHAGFEDAKFSGITHFEGATFNGEVHFERASFGTARFKDAVFLDVAQFEHATFGGAALFNETTFGKTVRFYRVTFSEHVQFERTKFSGMALFERAFFSKNAHFDHADFLGEVQFFRADFVGDAKFIGAKFAGDASFLRASFKGVLRFRGAVFDGKAQFQRVIFSRNAYFGKVTFTRGAFFSNARFSSGAGFHRASFLGVTGLENVSFRGHAYFGGATFHDDAHFRSSIFFKKACFDVANFSSDAWFERVTFAGTASFRLSLFQRQIGFAAADFARDCDFTAIDVKRAFNLAGTRFKGEAPDFTQAHFAEAPRLDNIEVPKVPFWAGARDKDEASRFQALKRLAIQGHDHVREQEFFAGELRCRRSDHERRYELMGKGVVDTGRLFFAGLRREAGWSFPYDFFSAYGRSIWRPLVGLGVSIWLAAWGYWGFATNNTCAAGRSAAWFLSLKNGLLFLGSGQRHEVEDAYRCLYGLGTDASNLPATVGYLGIGQGLVSAIFIFLALLALRNLFKIK